jgi:hypothetical protein
MRIGQPEPQRLGVVIGFFTKGRMMKIILYAVGTTHSGTSPGDLGTFCTRCFTRGGALVEVTKLPFGKGGTWN